MTIGRVLLPALALIALAGCGKTLGERPLSRPATNASVDSGSKSGDPILGTAASGAAAGAVTGLATRPDHVDQQKPIWEK